MASNSSALGSDAEITPLLTQPLPRDHFPDGTSNPDIIYQILSEELLLDGNSKQNLATFCQTWESQQVRKLMDLAIFFPWISICFTSASCSLICPGGEVLCPGMNSPKGRPIASRSCCMKERISLKRSACLLSCAKFCISFGSVFRLYNWSSSKNPGWSAPLTPMPNRPM